MKAIPKKRVQDIMEWLPKHLHGGQGGQGSKPLQDLSLIHI